MNLERLVHGLLLLCCLLATSVGARLVAQTPPADAAGFDEAVAAYKAHDYEAALAAFAQLAAQETDVGRAALLHANAGTAAARAGSWGEAVWHLEAARRRRPADETVQRNLGQVQAKVGVTDDESSHFTETLLFLPLAFTSTQVSWFVSGLVALALLVLAGWRAGRLGRRAAWVAVLLLLWAAGTHVGDREARLWDGRRAVVISNTSVRAEPAAGGKLLFRLAPGSVVSDEEQRGEWRLIETQSGARGWVPVAEVRAAG